jgi:hypothetical protein
MNFSLSGEESGGLMRAKAKIITKSSMELIYNGIGRRERVENPKIKTNLFTFQLIVKYFSLLGL